MAYKDYKVCPKGAITIDLDKFKNNVKQNKRIAGLEQPPNAVYV